MTQETVGQRRDRQEDLRLRRRAHATQERIADALTIVALNDPNTGIAPDDEKAVRDCRARLARAGEAKS